MDNPLVDFYIFQRVHFRLVCWQPLAPTPWRGILTSLPVWGLAIAQVGHDWGFFTMATDLPKYMKSVLRFSIAKVRGSQPPAFASSLETTTKTKKPQPRLMRETTVAFC